MQRIELEEFWQDFIMQFDNQWYEQKPIGAPSYLYYSGSTTKSIQITNQKLDIVCLSSICPAIHGSSKVPDAHRNVAMFRDNKIWLFGCSWLFSDDMPEELSSFVNLGNQPLGPMLFNNQWQRGKFMFSKHQMAFARKSVFKKGSAEILLMEFFLNQIFMMQNTTVSKPN